MIYDRLTRIDTYRALSPAFHTAIAFLRSTNLANLPEGRTEIDGERVFGVVHEYHTSPNGSSRWESHRRYIDLQLILAGQERMLVADLDTLTEATPFDPSRDVSFYAGSRRAIAVDAQVDDFLIFFPHDGHRATIAVDDPGRVRKLVLKIAVE